MRQRSDEAKAELACGLFYRARDSLADDVRGHLFAALSALPDDKTPGQLTALLKRALAQTERV